MVLCCVPCRPSAIVMSLSTKHEHKLIPHTHHANPHVYLDVSIAGAAPARIEFGMTLCDVSVPGSVVVFVFVC